MLDPTHFYQDDRRRQAEAEPVRPLTRRELLLELACPAGFRSWRAPAKPFEKLPDDVLKRIITWGT